MNEREVTAAEDLAYIKQIITDSKNIIIDNGLDFIIWGIIVIVGLLLTYIDVKSGIDFHAGLAWIILIGFGWAYTFLRVYKKVKRARVSTFTGRLTSAVWFSSGISMSILGFVGPAFNAYHGVYISPLISIVLAVCYFIIGFLYQKHWISFLSIFWWAGAILIFIFPTIDSLLVMAAMMLFLQTVPGIILYIKSKKENKSEE